MKRQLATMCAAGLILALGSAAMATVNIELVAVGDPGNLPDIRYETPGYGAVGYAYNIGKYEVTNAQYAGFLNAVDTVDYPHGLYNPDMGSGYGGITQGGAPGNYTYSVIQGRGNKPVIYVSFWDACRFANWLHNGQGGGNTETGAYSLTPGAIANNTVTRDPGWQWAVTSEDEWYKAAYYQWLDEFVWYVDYPTGTNTAPTAEAPPGTDMANGSANYDNVVGDLTDVGAYMAKPSDSPFGTFDQGGNVWEWNESIIDVSSRGLRGGSLITDRDNHRLHASNRYNVQPDNDHAIAGFRVSQVPEPATLSLLALGACLPLLRKRK